MIHRLTATDTPMVRYTRTIFPSYAIKSDGLIDFDLKTSNGNIYPKKSISDTGLENISTVEFEVHAYK